MSWRMACTAQSGKPLRSRNTRIALANVDHEGQLCKKVDAELDYTRWHDTG